VLPGEAAHKHKGENKMEISNRRALEQVMVDFINIGTLGAWGQRLQTLKKFAYGFSNDKLNDMDLNFQSMLFTTRLQYSFSNEEMRDVAAGLYERIL
jgi:hypothetical protein